MDWFKIGENHASRAMRAVLDLDGSGADVLEGKARIPGPVRAKWSSGFKAPRDFVWTTHFMLLLVSSSARSAVLDAGLKGIDFEEVQLVDRTKTAHKYWLVVPTGVCGSMLYPPKVERHLDDYWLATGIIPDMVGYDGSDFAVPRRTLVLLCSERAAAVLRRLDAINVEITPASEAEIVFTKRRLDVKRRKINWDR